MAVYSIRELLDVLTDYCSDGTCYIDVSECPPEDDVVPALSFSVPDGVGLSSDQYVDSVDPSLLLERDVIVEDMDAPFYEHIFTAREVSLILDSFQIALHSLKHSENDPRTPRDDRRAAKSIAVEIRNLQAVLGRYFVPDNTPSDS